MSDYQEETARQQGNPRARRRGVPQDSQHAALSALEPVRLRSRARSPLNARSMEEVDRYILARYGEVARKILKRVRGVRLQHDLPGGERVHDGRSERVLCGRLERPAVHVRRWLEGTAIGADRDVCDDRRPGAPARADPVVLDGRAVAVSARRSAKSRCTSRSSRQRPSSIRLVDRESARHMGTSAADPDGGQRIAGTAAKRQADRHVAGGKGRTSPRRARTSPCCSATRSSCPCCSSCPRSSSSAAARRTGREDRCRHRRRAARPA